MVLCVEILLELLNLPVRGELIRAERHLDFPYLMRVTRLDCELGVLLEGLRAGPLDKLLAPAFEISQHMVDAVIIEAAAAGHEQGGEIGAELGGQRACGAQCGPDFRDDDRRAAEPARDGDCVEPGRAATAAAGVDHP